MKRKLLAYILVLLCIGSAFGAYSYFGQRRVRNQYIITLTETGFSPQTVTIARGDTVVFTTTRDRPFWPASDLHPTHEIYPEFDPKKPIDPDKSWSFRFDRVGTWNFHDHLDSYFRGTIEVADSRSSAGETAAITNFDQTCKDQRNTRKNLQCWQTAIQQELRSNNLDAAFVALDTFVAQNPSALGDCHGLTHEIGREAYRLFNHNKDFALSPKTSYCGYGFYHGFMEALVHTTNDMVQARAFCDYADKKLEFFIADAGGACLHGIGHGSVDDTPNPAFWGDARAVLKPALALCERVSLDQSQLFRCASGAFNALEILSDEGKYKLSANYKDPFWICREQPEKYKRACYTQFLVAAMMAANNNFQDTARFIDTIREDAYAQETLAGLAVERVRLQETDYVKTLQWCRSLPARFRVSCITGFAEGFLKYGPPQTEHVRAIDFCGSTLLSEEERRPCFDRVLSILRNFTTVAKAREICLSVEKPYQWNNCEYR